MFIAFYGYDLNGIDIHDTNQEVGVKQIYYFPHFF